MVRYRVKLLGLNSHYSVERLYSKVYAVLNADLFEDGDRKVSEYFTKCLAGASGLIGLRKQQSFSGHGGCVGRGSPYDGISRHKDRSEVNLAFPIEISLRVARAAL